MAISIIGLLVTIGVVSYSSVLKNSRDAKRKADLEQIRAAEEMYRSVNGLYPSVAPGNCTNIQPTISPYLPKTPSDPKSTQNYYCDNSLGSTYTVGSALETGSGSCAANGCGASTNCNYCVGPYGQTYP
ncbi:MAG: hypothetical protein M1409_09835 [Actinobacteria bacterium]|nr:hypothetical protein [Actinomycetota bacterium]